MYVQPRRGRVIWPRPAFFLVWSSGVKRFLGYCMVLVLITLFQTGCMSRRITVRTQPPGALVEMNGNRLGPSPVSTNFTYYGDKRIQDLCTWI